MYRVSVSPQARKQLKQISKQIHQEALGFAIEELKENPHLGKPLTRNLTGKLALRIGIYRIVYRIKEKDNLVEILIAGHRSNVY